MLKNKSVKCLVCLCMILLISANYVYIEPKKAKAIAGETIVGAYALQWIVGLALGACGVYSASESDLKANTNYVIKNLAEDQINYWKTLSIIAGAVWHYDGEYWDSLVTTISNLFQGNTGSNTMVAQSDCAYYVPLSTSGPPIYATGISAYQLFSTGYYVTDYSYSSPSLSVSLVRDSTNKTDTYTITTLYGDTIISTMGYYTLSMTSQYLYHFIVPTDNCEGLTMFNLCRTYGNSTGYSDSNSLSTYVNSYYVILASGVSGLLSQSYDAGSSKTTVSVGNTDVATYNANNGYLKQVYLYDLLLSGSTLSYVKDNVSDMPYVNTETGIDITVPNEYTDILTMTAADVIPATAVPENPPVEKPTDMPDMSLPEVIFKEKFPFCLPWDLYNTFASLAVPAEPPVFEITIPMEQYGYGLHDENLTIDFSQYDKLAVITRWGISIAFIVGLILVTRKMIGAQ